MTLVTDVSDQGKINLNKGGLWGPDRAGRGCPCSSQKFPRQRKDWPSHKPWSSFGRFGCRSTQMPPPCPPPLLWMRSSLNLSFALLEELDASQSWLFFRSLTPAHCHAGSLLGGGDKSWGKSGGCFFWFRSGLFARHQAASFKTMIMIYQGASCWLNETNCKLEMFLDQERRLYQAFGLTRSLSKVESIMTRESIRLAKTLKQYDQGNLVRTLWGLEGHPMFILGVEYANDPCLCWKGGLIVKAKFLKTNWMWA